MNLALHVFYALDDNPFGALVTFSLLDMMFFVLSYILTRNHAECRRGARKVCL
jgi:hypothetical protein